MRAPVAVLAAATLCAGTYYWQRSSGPDYPAATDDLRERLLAVDGVDDVQVSFEPGDVLFAGSITVQVRMQSGADSSDMLSVVDEAYRDFSGTFGADHADLAIRAGHDRIELHTKDPSADESDVQAVVAFTLDAPGVGERATADINARDEDNYSDLESEVVVHLPKNSTADDVIPRLDELAELSIPDRTGTGVVASDGAGITGAEGLPLAEDRQLWAELSAADFTEPLHVQLKPLNIADDSDAWFVYVPLTRAPHPPARRQQLIVTLLREHFAALVRATDGFNYNLGLHSRSLAFFQTGLCDNQDVPSWQEDLSEPFADLPGC